MFLYKSYILIILVFSYIRLESILKSIFYILKIKPEILNYEMNKLIIINKLKKNKCYEFL